MMSCTPIGGIGNQLFIVAACIGAAEKLGTQYAIPRSWNNAYYFNGPFSLEDAHLPKWKEGHFRYEEIAKDNVSLEGYFQSEKYFIHCKDKIKDLFKPNKEIGEYMDDKYAQLFDANKTLCGVHVRRGDYLKLPDYHYNLEKEYYQGIMKAYSGHYVIFSDDIDWCKDNLTAPLITFIDSGKDIVDFFLMTKLHNWIIANSSFSWWASYLGKKKGSMIFAPPKHKWFGEKKRHLNVDDLYMDDWIIQKQMVGLK